jgi:hypothetical protein
VEEGVGDDKRLSNRTGAPAVGLLPLPNGLPMLVFMTVGLVLTLIFGDVLFSGIAFLLAS